MEKVCGWEHRRKDGTRGCAHGGQDATSSVPAVNEERPQRSKLKPSHH